MFRPSFEPLYRYRMFIRPTMNNPVKHGRPSNLDALANAPERTGSTASSTKRPADSRVQPKDHEARACVRKTPSNAARNNKEERFQAGSMPDKKKTISVIKKSEAFCTLEMIERKTQTPPSRLMFDRVTIAGLHAMHRGRATAKQVYSHSYKAAAAEKDGASDLTAWRL